jgi:hypothetical protein
MTETETNKSFKLTEAMRAFRQKPEYRDRLAEIVADPVFQLAESIVRDSAVPKVPTPQELATLADVVYSRQLLVMAGENQGLDKIASLSRQLAKVNETDTDLLSKAYDHTIPAQFREQQEPKY